MVGSWSTSKKTQTDGENQFYGDNLQGLGEAFAKELKGNTCCICSCGAGSITIQPNPKANVRADDERISANGNGVVTASKPTQVLKNSEKYYIS